jgi:hypothetical protein
MIWAGAQPEMIKILQINRRALIGILSRIHAEGGPKSFEQRARDGSLMIAADRYRYGPPILNESQSL